MTSLSLPSARSPTVLVKQLGHGNCAECDRGFIVMNRPWGVVQFVQSDYFKSRIEEEYIFIIETDHMMMRPPENVAKPDLPVGFGFYYMLGTLHAARALPCAQFRTSCRLWIPRLGVPPIR